MKRAGILIVVTFAIAVLLLSAIGTGLTLYLNDNSIPEILGERNTTANPVDKNEVWIWPRWEDNRKVGLIVICPLWNSMGLVFWDRQGDSFNMVTTANCSDEFSTAKYNFAIGGKFVDCRKQKMVVPIHLVKQCEP